MILNPLSALFLVVGVITGLFIAWLYTKPGKKWLDEGAGLCPPYLSRASNRSSFLMLLPAFFTLAFKSPIR